MRDEQCPPDEALAISSGNAFAARPGDEEVDRHIAANPWTLRKRLTYDAYATRCRQAGKQPEMGEWLDHLRLDDDEVKLINDLIEARREAHCLELGPRFTIREYGNKARVGWFNDRDELVTMSHAEKVVEVGRDKDGKPIMKPLVPHWLRHPLTTRYESVEFRPGVEQSDMSEGRLNLWRGWPLGLRPGWDDNRLTVAGAEPVRNGELDGPELPPGHCDLFLDHMLHAMCGGDEEVRHFLLGWMADGLWNPGPCETAIVMHGPEGSGKSLWAQHYMEFHAPHALTLDDPQQVIGNFNKHLMNKSVVFADEAFFAGHPGHAAKLKTLVTRPDLFVEPKGVDGFVVPKMFRLIMASNEDHVIRAGREDRRYLVLNVDAGARNRDKAYFGALVDEWRGGGRAALFRWLTGAWWGRAVSDGRFKTWSRPVTAALQRQKVLSLSPAEQFRLGILEDGILPGARPSNRRAARDTVLSRSLFEAMRERSPELRNTSDQRLGRLLEGWGCTKWKSGDERGWTFPPLGEMRAAWGEHGWPDDASEWNDPPPF